MDFKALHYFQTVAEELNFTRAAERLNMSQPPLSSQIRDLERDLGVQLFIRGNRKLTLTPEGELLLQRTIQMFNLSEQTRSELLSLTRELSGTLRIGTVGGRAPFFASRWIYGFREEYPLVHFQLWNGSTDEVVDLMKNGLLDLSVVCAPYDQEQLKGITVGKEPWVALLPAEHPLVRQDPDARNITLRQIANEPLIIPHRKYRETAIRNWFAGIGEEPNIICELSDYLDAVALVEQGVGIAIFPHTTYTPNLLAATRIITEPAKYAQYEVVWRRNDSMPALTHEFINYIRDFLQEDLIHTAEIYRVYGTEFEVPEGAKLL